MTHTPTIPRGPEGLPQQRINPVVDLPPRPVGVDFTVGFDIFPDPQMARRPWPRRPEFLVQIEFAETPMHNGLSAYYIEGRRKHWMLWERYYDDNDWTPRWRWQASGYCRRRGVDQQAAAAHLLAAFWVKADEAPGDGDHWIVETGMFSVEEVRAIARKVGVQRGSPAQAAWDVPPRAPPPPRRSLEEVIEEGDWMLELWHAQQNTLNDN